MSSENVLQRLLKPKKEEKILESFLRPQPIVKKRQERKPGRPKVSDEKKARNFTLCLAPQYLEFLDKMVVKNTKIQGRGRKIRFIIDRFIEHEKRSIQQLKVLKDSLHDVQKILSGFGGKVIRGESLHLSTKEKAEVSAAVDKVHILLQVLHYSPKTLQRILPREDWALVSFCLNWRNNREIKL